MLDLVLGRLREESRAAGKLPLFDHLKQFLAGQLGKGPPILRLPNNWL